MDRFTARRRLLRGSLSAPLVLTVAASPAALAARGSWEACLLRAGQDPAQADPIIPIPGKSHDTWLRLRVPLYRGNLKLPNEERLADQSAELDAKNAVEKEPLKGSPPAGGGAQGGGSEDKEKEFYLLKERYYPLEPTAEACDQGGYPEADFQNIKPADAEVQLLVYVDETGRVVAVGPCAPATGGEGFPVSASCWASFGGMQGVG